MQAPRDHGVTRAFGMRDEMVSEAFAIRRPRHDPQLAKPASMRYDIVRPPLTLRVWPVMKAAASEARNVTAPAISVG